MNERELFNEWHFNNWRYNFSNNESLDMDKEIYSRVYSSDVGVTNREKEFTAWQAATQRDGFVFVPIQVLKDAIYELQSSHYHHIGSGAYYAAEELKELIIDSI